jgi:hypothetical protein
MCDWNYMKGRKWRMKFVEFIFGRKENLIYQRAEINLHNRCSQNLSIIGELISCAEKNTNNGTTTLTILILESIRRSSLIEATSQ